VHRVALLLSLLAGCDLVFELRDPTDASEPLEGRARTLTITQPTSMALQDFPVSILFENDEFLISGGAAPDGSDIQFFASADDGGAELSAEVRYDGATGTLEAWVKVPSLKPSPFQIEMRYGTGEGRLLDPRSTWSSSYVGVWHLSETGSTEKDSTPLGIDVAATTDKIPMSAPGISGAARDFDGVDDIMCAIDSSDLDFGMESFAYGAWVFISQPSGNADRPLNKGAGNANNPGFNYELGTGAAVSNISDGAGRADSAVIAGFTLGLGRWTLLTTTVDRPAQTMRVFVDGVEDTFEVIPDLFASTSGPSPLCFSNAAQPFKGLLDEVRIYRGVQPAEWYRAEASNLLERDLFVKVASDLPR
jgi:hypothetical protein